MRRGPEEDDEEQDDGLPPLVRLAGRGVVADDRPADHCRHTACEATPDDVLGVSHFQELRIDEHVEEVRQEHEEGCKPRVREYAQPEDGKKQHDPREDGCVTARNLGAYQRPCTRALHLLVDFIVDNVVKSMSSCRAHPAAEDGGQNQPEVIRHGLDSTLCLEHRRDCGNKEELNDPRLRQRKIGLDRLQGLFLQYLAWVYFSCLGKRPQCSSRLFGLNSSRARPWLLNHASLQFLRQFQ